MGRLISTTKEMYSTWTIQVTAFVICVAFVHSAPFQNATDGRTSREKGCYYLSEHYQNGERIDTYEPCLNCTCMNSVLMCYLRICPFVKPVGEECIVERDEGDCCPKIWCPEVLNENPNQNGQEPGCYLEGKYYPDGAQLPHDPKHPCEVCYCIRNSTACVVQECELKVEGCSPIYKEGQCCPGRYNCTYEEATPTPPGVTVSELAEGCYLDDGTIVSDGEAVNSSNPCEHCYCMRNEVVCAIQECQAPSNNCKPVPPKPDQCCPDRYECVISAESADGSFIHPEHSEEGLKFTTVFTKDFSVSHGSSYLESHHSGIKGVPKKDIDVELKPVYDVSTDYSSTTRNIETTSAPGDYSSIKAVKVPGIKGASKIHTTEQTTPSKVLEVKRIVSTDSDTEISASNQENDETTEESESHPLSTSTKATHEEISTASPKPLRVIGVKGASKKGPTGSIPEDHDIKAAASVEEDKAFTSASISAKKHSSDAASSDHGSRVTQQGIKGRRPPTRRPPQERPSKRPSGDSFSPEGIKQSGVKDSVKTGYHHVKGKRPIPQKPILPVGVIPGEQRDPLQTTKQPVAIQPIPGEGICRLGDVIYRHGEEIAPMSACKKNCKCVNSKVFCEEITCDTSDYPNCKILQRPDECCPRYECGTEETSSIASVSVTEVSYDDYLFVTSGVEDGKEHITIDSEAVSEDDDSLGSDHTKDLSITQPTTHDDESIVHSSSTTSADVSDTKDSTTEKELIEYLSSTTLSDEDDSEPSTTSQESINSKFSPEATIKTSFGTTLETSSESTVSTTLGVSTKDSESTSTEVPSTLSPESIPSSTQITEEKTPVEDSEIPFEKSSTEGSISELTDISFDGISKITLSDALVESEETSHDFESVTEESSDSEHLHTSTSSVSYFEEAEKSTEKPTADEKDHSTTHRPFAEVTDSIQTKLETVSTESPIASETTSEVHESTTKEHTEAFEVSLPDNIIVSSTEDNIQKDIHNKQTETSEYSTEFPSTQENTDDTDTKKIPDSIESDSFFSKITAFFTSTISTHDIETSEDSFESTESPLSSSSHGDITTDSTDISKSTDPKDLPTVSEELSTRKQDHSEVSTHSYFSEDVEDTSISSEDFSSVHSEEVHKSIPSTTHVPTDVPNTSAAPTTDETEEETITTVVFDSSEKYTELEISTPSKETSETYPTPDSMETSESDEAISTEHPITENLNPKKTYESTIIEVSTEYPVKSLHTSPPEVISTEKDAIDSTEADSQELTITEQKSTIPQEAVSEETIKPHSESDKEEQYRRPASAITNDETTLKAHTEDHESTTQSSHPTDVESTTRFAISDSTSASSEEDTTTHYSGEPVTTVDIRTTYTEKSHSTSQGSFEPGNLILETSKPDTSGLVKKTLPSSENVEDSTFIEKTHSTTHAVFEPENLLTTTQEPDTVDLIKKTVTASEDVEESHTDESSLTTQGSFADESIPTLQVDDSDDKDISLETVEVQESTQSGISETESSTSEEIFSTENLLATTVKSDTSDLEEKIAHSSTSVEDLSSVTEDTTSFTTLTPKETPVESSSAIEEQSTTSEKGSELEVVTSSQSTSTTEVAESTEHKEIHYDTEALESTTSTPEKIHLSENEIGDFESEKHRFTVDVSTTVKEEPITFTTTEHSADSESSSSTFTPSVSEISTFKESEDLTTVIPSVSNIVTEKPDLHISETLNTHDEYSTPQTEIASDSHIGVNTIEDETKFQPETETDYGSQTVTSKDDLNIVESLHHTQKTDSPQEPDQSMSATQHTTEESISKVSDEITSQHTEATYSVSDEPSTTQREELISETQYFKEQPITQNVEGTVSPSHFSTQKVSDDTETTASSVRYSSEYPTEEQAETTDSTAFFSTKQPATEDTEITHTSTYFSTKQSETAESLKHTSINDEETTDNAEVTFGAPDISDDQSEVADTSIDTARFSTKTPINELADTVSSKHTIADSGETTVKPDYFSTKQEFSENAETTINIEHHPSTENPTEKDFEITSSLTSTKESPMEHEIVTDTNKYTSTKQPADEYKETTVTTVHYPTDQFVEEHVKIIGSSEDSINIHTIKEVDETNINVESFSTALYTKDHSDGIDSKVYSPTQPTTEHKETTATSSSISSNQAETTQPPSYPSTQDHAETTQPPSYPSTHDHVETSHPPSYPSTHDHVETTQPPSYPSTHDHAETTHPPSYPSTHDHVETTHPPSYPSTHDHEETTQPPSYPSTHDHVETTHLPSYTSTHDHAETSQPPSYPSTHDDVETTHPSSHHAESTQPPSYISTHDHAETTATSLHFSTEKQERYTETTVRPTHFSTKQIITDNAETTVSSHFESEDFTKDDTVFDSTEQPSDHSIHVSYEHITSDTHTSSSINDFNQDKATTLNNFHFTGTSEPTTQKYVSHETSEPFTEDEVTSQKITHHAPTHSESGSSSNENTESFFTQEYSSSDVHSDTPLTELYDNEKTSTSVKDYETTVKYISTTGPTNVSPKDTYPLSITSEKQTSGEADQVHDIETTPELLSSVQTTVTADVLITTNDFDLENEEGKHIENTETSTRGGATETTHHFLEKEITDKPTENEEYSTLAHETEVPVTTSHTTNSIEDSSTEKDLQDHESTDNDIPSDEVTSKFFHPKFSVVTFITRRGSTQTPSVDNMVNEKVTEEIEKPTSTPSTPTVVTDKDGGSEIVFTTHEVETDSSTVTSEKSTISESLKIKLSSTQTPSTVEKTTSQAIENETKESVNTISFKPETTTPFTYDFTTFIDEDDEEELIKKDTHTTITPNFSQVEDRLSTSTDSYHETVYESTHFSVSEDYEDKIISTSSDGIKEQSSPEKTKEDQVTEKVFEATTEVPTRPSIHQSETEAKITAEVATEASTHHSEAEVETTAEVATEESVHHSKTDAETTAKVATEVHHFEADAETTAEVATEASVHHSETDAETTAKVATEASVHHSETDAETTAKVATESSVHHSETDAETTAKVATEASVHHSETDAETTAKVATEVHHSETDAKTTAKVATEAYVHHSETDAETTTNVATEASVHHSETDAETSAKVATEASVHHFETDAETTAKVATEASVHHSETDAETTSKLATEASVHHSETDAEITTKVATEPSVHHSETDAQTTAKVATEPSVHHSETDAETTAKVATEASVHHSIDENSENSESTTAEINQEEEIAEEFGNDGQVGFEQSITLIGDFGFTETEKDSGFHETFSTNLTSKNPEQPLKTEVVTTHDVYPTVEAISSESSLFETTMFAEQSEETEEPFSTQTIEDKYETSTFSHKENSFHTQFGDEKVTKIQTETSFTTVTPHDFSHDTKNDALSHSSISDSKDEPFTPSSELDVEDTNLDERKRVTTDDSNISLNEDDETENSLVDKKVLSSGLSTIMETESEALSTAKENGELTTTTIPNEFSPSSTITHIEELAPTSTTRFEVQTNSAEQDLKLEAGNISEVQVTSSPQALSSGQEESSYPQVEEILISAHVPHTSSTSQTSFSSDESLDSIITTISEKEELSSQTNEDTLSSSSSYSTTEDYSSETKPAIQSTHQTQDYGFHKETYSPYIHTIPDKDDISSEESTQSTKSAYETTNSFESHSSESEKPASTYGETSETLSSEINTTPFIDAEDQEIHHTGSYFTESNIETKPLLVPQNLVLSPEKPLKEDNLPLKSPDDIIAEKPLEKETVRPEYTEIDTPTEAVTEIVQASTPESTKDVEVTSTHINENKLTPELELHTESHSTHKHDEMNIISESTTTSIPAAVTSQSISSEDLVTDESSIEHTNPPFSTQAPLELFDQTNHPELVTESAIFTFPAEAVVFDSQINKDTFSILITDNPLEETEITSTKATSLSTGTDHPTSEPHTEYTHVKFPSISSIDDSLHDKVETSSDKSVTSSLTAEIDQETKEPVYDTTNLKDKIITASEEINHLSTSPLETADADKVHSVHEELAFDTTTQKYVDEKIVTNPTSFPSTNYPESTPAPTLVENDEDVSKSGELFSITSEKPTESHKETVPTEESHSMTSTTIYPSSFEQSSLLTDKAKPSESNENRFESIETDLNELSISPHQDEQPTSITEEYDSSSEEVTSKDTTDPSTTQKPSDIPPTTSTFKEGTTIPSTTSYVSKSSEHISYDHSEIPDDNVDISTPKDESFTDGSTSAPTTHSNESVISEETVSHETTDIADATKLEQATSVHPIYKPTIEDIVFRPITSTEIPVTTVTNASDALLLAKTTKAPQQKIPITTLSPTTQQLLESTLFPHSIHPSTLLEAFAHSTTLPPHHPHHAAADSHHDEGHHFSQEDGYCVYESEIYHSAEQIPRKDPCEFCFCFRGDIICLQQSCPPPIRGCYATPIPGFCCPRFHCPVKEMHFNLTRTTTTTTADPRIGKILVPAAIETTGCAIEGKVYRAHQVVRPASGPCMLCRCETGGIMKCDPRDCQPQAPLLLRLNRDFFKKR